MNNSGKNWSREEVMLAFELYCIIPNGKDTDDNPLIMELAKALGRTANSVKMKLQNFKHCDPTYTKDGKVGLKGVSKIDKEVCAEFFQNWNDLISETSIIKQNLGLNLHEETTEEMLIIPAGKDRIITSTQRVGQSFFRKALLAAYDYRCCFTGISVPELLRASHIKPWSESNCENEKTNPQNGLLLNALHDAAFDKGYITITLDYKIVVSKILLSESEANRQYFVPLNGQKMILPNRFVPDRRFIEYHNSIFKE